MVPRTIFTAGTSKSIVKLNKVVSWALVCLTILMMVSGYIISKRLFPQFTPIWSITREIHLLSEWFFLVLFAFHFLVTVFFIRFNWSSVIRRISNRGVNSLLTIKLIQRITGWLVFVATFLVILSGIGWYNLPFDRILPFLQHTYYDLFLFLAILVHAAFGAKIALTRRKIGRRLSNAIILSFVIILSLVFVSVDSIGARGVIELPDDIEPEPPEGTKPEFIGRVAIGNDAYTFDPRKVETVRPDIFNTGFFSIFDVLVHLDKQEEIELEYHFDVSMNTYIIDSINGEANWWYQVYYDGGWPESNVFRPDHYPWKDKTTLTFFKMNPSVLQDIYSMWKEEIERRITNNGKLIIPRVIIRGLTFKREFKNIEVTSHNLRNDVFRDKVTTAIDVIMSLGDQEKITYELQWYESIGTAGIVKDYWVEAIDSDKAHDRCGFVYEAGSPKYTFFQGNHIHLPSDIRVLNSPEYVEFFWICI